MWKIIKVEEKYAEQQENNMRAEQWWHVGTWHAAGDLTNLGTIVPSPWWNKIARDSHSYLLSSVWPSPAVGERVRESKGSEPWIDCDSWGGRWSWAQKNGAATLQLILQQLHSKTVLAHIGAFSNKYTIKHPLQKVCKFMKTASLCSVWKKINFLQFYISQIHAWHIPKVIEITINISNN